MYPTQCLKTHLIIFKWTITELRDNIYIVLVVIYLVIPITPQAILAPALPVVELNS